MDTIKAMMMDDYKAIFGEKDIWEIFDIDATSFRFNLDSIDVFRVDGLGLAEKAAVLANFDLGKLDENALIHICVLADRSEGWAFSSEAFHVINAENSFLTTIMESEAALYKFLLPSNYCTYGEANDLGELKIVTNCIEYKDIAQAEAIRELSYGIMSTEILRITDKNGLSFDYRSCLVAGIADKMARFLNMARE